MSFPPFDAVDAVLIIPLAAAALLALLPGYRVTARTTSGQFVYHTDERGNVVTCGPLPRRPRALPEAGGAGDQPRTQPPVVSPDR